MSRLKTRLFNEISDTLAINDKDFPPSVVNVPMVLSLRVIVGVAEDSFDAALVPTEFIADTLYVYAVPVVRLV